MATGIAIPSAVAVAGIVPPAARRLGVPLGIAEPASMPAASTVVVVVVLVTAARPISAPTAVATIVVIVVGETTAFVT
jgi:hypothetical protein